MSPLGVVMVAAAMAIPWLSCKEGEKRVKKRRHYAFLRGSRPCLYGRLFAVIWIFDCRSSGKPVVRVL
jgi:hypothetical protein